LVSVSVWFFPGLANDSGSSESSLGMMIKAKLSLTFMQNVICKPPAMSLLLIFFFPALHFYPSTIHSVKFEEKGSLRKNDWGIRSSACLHLELISNINGHVLE